MIGSAAFWGDVSASASVFDSMRCSAGKAKFESRFVFYTTLRAFPVHRVASYFGKISRVSGW